MERIAIGSDHGGYELKEVLREKLRAEGYDIVDLGTNTEDSVDYPEYGANVARTVLSGKADRGVVICGTGIGISVAANRFKGIRAALCTSVEMAELAREHNNSNVLALGGRTTPFELALEILDTWLVTEFEGGRHNRRIEMLDNLEGLR